MSTPGALLDIAGWAENDIFSHGYICPKGYALKDLHEDPDRLRTPLVRRGGHLVEATWDQAFAEIDVLNSALRDALERPGADARLDEASKQRVGAAADSVSRIVDKGETVYGVNTGFGKLASTRISAADLALLQLNLIRSHSVGVGEPLAPAVVRLMLATKAASLARGASK